MCREKHYDHDDHKKCCGCLQGVQGVPGLQGEQGIQGLPGAQGPAGKDCSHDHHDCDCPEGYLNVWSEVSRIIGAWLSPTDALVFEGVNQASPEFDISMAGVGQIKILQHGIYQLAFGVIGTLNPPFPDPVPPWALALFKNGVRVPGTTFGGFNQSPDDKIENADGRCIIECQVNDVLMIRNITLNHGINLVAASPFLALPASVSSLDAVLIKKLP